MRFAVVRDLPRPLLLGVLGLSLGACGLAVPGGDDTARKPRETHPPAIADTVLPEGRIAVAYPSTRLVVEGAESPYRWALWSGALPPGIALSEGGTIAGTPAQTGAFAFTVHASNGFEVLHRDLGIGVDALGLVAEGLAFGDAWTGTTVPIVAVGARGSVRFEVVSTGSGGRFLAIDAEGGRASWAPGAVAGVGVKDRLRAFDQATGRTAEILLPVMPHPAPWHRAGFGSSDVWHVRFDGKAGTHFFSSDFDRALAQAGLRSSASGAGTLADRVASFCVRREVLRRLNVLFLRPADGQPGTGLPISFPMDEPDPAYARALPGEALTGDASRYSVLSVVDGEAAGFTGQAYQDSTLNESHENDSPSATGELGVFVNRMVEPFAHAWQNETLPASPIGDADLPALRAIAYGLPDPGGRSAEIRRIVEGFGRVLGDPCAHEIGHGLGLGHTVPTRVGSVMNVSATISPSLLPAFLAEDLDVLERSLPGQGRMFGASKPAPALLPEGGVCTCGHAGD